MKAEDESSILRGIAPFKKYTEYVENKKNSLGFFAIISNLDLNPSELYVQYESREEVKQVFDTMKVNLESEKTYLSDS